MDPSRADISLRVHQRAELGHGLALKLETDHGHLDNAIGARREPGGLKVERRKASERQIRRRSAASERLQQGHDAPLLASCR
jgi:hypothetical protein